MSALSFLPTTCCPHDGQTHGKCVWRLDRDEDFRQSGVQTVSHRVLLKYTDGRKDFWPIEFV